MKNLLREIFMFLSSASMIIMVQATSLLTINIVNTITVTIIGIICMFLMFSGIFLIKQKSELFYEKMFNIGRLFAILAIFPLIAIGNENFKTVFVISEILILLVYIVFYFYNKEMMIIKKQ